MVKKRCYCPYCDVYLVHQSLRSRRDHALGWKHLANMQTYYSRFLTLQPHIDDDDDYDQRSNVTTKAPAVNQTAPINPVKVLPKIKFTPPKIQSSLSTKAIPSKNSQSRSNNENPTSPAKSGPPSLSHPKIGPPKVGPSSNGSKSIAPPPLGSTSK